MANNSLIIDPSNSKKFSPKSLPVTIRELTSYSDDTYDVDPDYQRDFVWKSRRKQKLIDSIVSGRSINALHICRKTEMENFDKYWVIDGKQRLSTIREFFSGKSSQNCPPFTIVIKLDNGQQRRASFKQIQSLAKTDRNCQLIVRNFLEYTLTFNLYDENLTVDEQKDLFECINYSENLTHNENLFCCNYVARNFYRRIYYGFLHKELSSFFSKNYINNVKECGTKWTAELLYMSFGMDLDSEFDYREVASKIDEVVERTNTKLKGKGYSGQTDFDNVQVLSKEQSEVIKDVVSSFAYVLSDKKDVLRDSMKDSGRSWINDCVMWMVRKFQDQTLTSSYVKENYTKFFELFRDFLRWRNSPENSELKQAAGNRERIKKRLNALEDLFCSSKFAFDKGKKNRKVPSDKLEVLLDAPMTDPMTGRLLRSDNIEIDHVNAKSLSSKTKFVAIDERSNKKKSNNSIEFTQRQIDYQKENET